MSIFPSLPVHYTSTGQKNAANSAAGFAQPAASEVAPLTSARSAMWVFVWRRVSPITTKKRICKPCDYN